MKVRQTRPQDSGAGGAVLSVRIQPRASKNGFSRMEDGSLKIRLTAPPVDGAANEALITLLAGIFGIAKSRVEILSGHTGRRKIVRIDGINDEDALKVLRETGP